MMQFPIPFNEEARLQAVLNVPGLTHENEALFDAICDATRKLLDCPVAHISVLEGETQWYKSVVGIELDRMPREASFCAYTIMSDEPMVVPDLSKDPKFADHPMVAEGGPQARYYAGVPLVLSSGHRFGSLCALDFDPHEAPSEAQMAVLHDLGKAVVAALEKAPAAPAHREEETGPSAFVTLIGHELRTPLTVMFGSLRLLEARMSDPVDIKLASGACKSVEHLNKLIETIISFSDATTGELRLHETTADLAEVVAEVVEMHVPGADGTGKSITLDPVLVDSSVLIDSDQIKLALTALVLNAVFHGGPAIRVHVALDEAGHLEIRVSDDGRLDEHVELAELYKPFVVGGELDQRGTRGGLGLGLPLTRKLVELHGGRFEVRPLEDRTDAVIRLPRWRIGAAPRSDAA